MTRFDLVQVPVQIGLDINFDLIIQTICEIFRIEMEVHLLQHSLIIASE